MTLIMIMIMIMFSRKLSILQIMMDHPVLSPTLCAYHQRVCSGPIPAVLSGKHSHLKGELKHVII